MFYYCKMLQKYGILITAAFCLLHHREVVEAVFGGQQAEIAKVPYLIHFLLNGEYLYAGSLVSELHVVTTANMGDYITRPKQITAMGGVVNLKAQGVRREVQEIIPHPNYDVLFAIDYNVAVVILASPMTGTNIKPIPLCNTPSWNVGEKIKITGWNRKHNGPELYYQIARTTQVPIINFNKCLKGVFFTINAGISVCARQTKTNGFCFKDSGGPGVYKGALCAVISWTHYCGAPKRPLVLTNIRFVRDFIEDAMKN